MEHEWEKQKPDEDAVLEDANEAAAVWGINIIIVVFIVIIVIVVIIVIIITTLTFSWSNDKVIMKH
jgi:heme/copper-type cytochrome/quinol oxidase subunit 2